MKKFFLIVFVLFLLCIPTFVFAQDYDIDESLKLNFDDDWYVFTRNNIKVFFPL